MYAACVVPVNEVGPAAKLSLTAWVARLLCVMCLILAASSVGAFSPPAFQGDVLDETGRLSAEQHEVIKQRIQDLRTRDGIWSAVYLAESLQGVTIEEAAVSTFEKWKLGEKGKDNGLLVMLVPKERKMRIEVGYGLEGSITDALSKRILDDIYKPAFREDRYAEGLLSGFDFMALVMRKGAAALPETGTAAGSKASEIDAGMVLQRLLWVWLGNLCIPVIYWLSQRDRLAKGRTHKIAADKLRTAFILFAFLGFFFGIFIAVFSAALPDDPTIVMGLLGANALFDLVFFVPMLLAKWSSQPTSREAGSSQDGTRWRTSNSSSSSDSDSSDSSSSGGGSSGGGGASGNY